MNPKRFIWMLAPKGWGGLLLLIVFLFMFGVAILPHLLNLQGALLVGAVLALLAVLAFALPSRAYDLWDALPAGLRGSLLGFAVYALVVTIGNWAELYSLRLWWDFLFLREGAPWSSVNSVALAGALWAFTTQSRTYPDTLPPDEERVISGHRLISVAEARERLNGAATTAPRTLFWGTLELPESFATQHFCIIGSSGSGKSKSIQLLMQSVFRRPLAGTNRRALVYDAKRDMYSTLRAVGVPADKIVILNPFDQRCSAWDMARDICDAATASEIATILSPDERDPNPFFPKAAQSLVGGVMEAYTYLAPGRWTLRDVVLALREEKRLRAVLGRCPQTQYLVQKYLPGTDTQHDISATIENTMRRLAFVAAAWDRANTSFSVRQWIEGESVLLLGNNPSLQSTVQQLNAALFHRIAQLVRSQPDADKQAMPGQTWFFIDELRLAGELPRIPELLVEGRSKGVCLVLGFQDVPGLYKVWEEKLANEIIGACRNKSFLKITDQHTARFATEFFGNQEIEITRYNPSWSFAETDSGSDGSTSTTETKSVSVNRTLHTRPVIPPAAFQQIKDASPKNGIGGYYYLSEVGEPFYSVLPGDFVSGQLHPTSPKAPDDDGDLVDIVDRPAEHQTLRDWDRADLERLGLGSCSELLQAGTPNGDSTPPAATKEQQKPKIRLPRREL